jgi:hypothetical protein
MILAKIALGLAGTVAVAGAYTFHEGVISIEQQGRDGQHIHFWVPAAMVPIAVRAVPARYLECHTRQAAEWLPVARSLSKELRHYPEVDFVDVTDSREHVHIRTHNGRLVVDITGDDENVHVALPLVTLDEVVAALDRSRGAA